jgi:toxin ParE1/3/4
MPFAVLLTDDAVIDLEELHSYLDEHTVDGRADHVLGQIETAFSKLNEHPERGNFPKELVTIGIRDYREIHFKPYRIIYRIMGTNVYVYLMVDGRRDMQTLLLRRLLGG